MIKRFNKRMLAFILVLILTFSNSHLIYAIQSEKEQDDTMQPILRNDDYGDTLINENSFPLFSPSEISVYAVNDMPEFYISPYITSVKHQGFRNLCWAYSTNAAFESAIVKKEGVIDGTTVSFDLQNNVTITVDASSKHDFSEEHIGYSTSNYGNHPYGYDIGGGTYRKPGDVSWCHAAIAYLTRSNVCGSVYEFDDHYSNHTFNDLPIRDVSVTTSKAMADYYPSEIQGLGNSTVNNKLPYISAIKNYVYENGNAVASYRQNSTYIKQGNIYLVSGSKSGHSVEIIGWDDNYSHTNFLGTNDNSLDGAFIVKNSVGSVEGNHGGFFYISYDCADKLYSIYSFKNIKNKDFFDNVYEYDEKYEDDWTYLHKVVCNVFERNSEFDEYITAVSNRFVPKQQEFKVYISPDGNFSNFINVKLKNRDGEYIYTSDNDIFLLEEIETPIKITSNQFAVAFEIVTNSSALPEVCYEDNDVQQGVTYKAHSIDSTNWVVDNALNACIKAFTISNDRNYNITNSAFDNYVSNTILATNRTIDGLTIHHSSTKPISFDTISPKSIYGIAFNRRLKLNGEGNLNERCVSLNVIGDTDIYIAARKVSEATDDRQLRIVNSSGTLLKKQSVSVPLKVYKYHYTGNKDTLYFYSYDSSIDIYAVSAKEHYYSNDTINKEWKFSDPTFNGYSNISTATEIDGLTIIGGHISNNSVTVDGTKYTAYLGLDYAGTNTSRTAKFDVPGNCMITLVGRSTGQETRNIGILNKYGYLVGEMPVTNEASEQTFYYEGGADTLYIRSQSGGIRLYDIDVKSVESEPRVIRNDRSGYATAPTNVGTEIEINTDNQIAVQSYDNVISGSAFEINDDIISGSAISVMRSPSNNRNSTLNSDFMYYDQLSAPQKQIYNAMYQKLTSHPVRDNNLRLRYPINVTDNVSNRATLRQNIKSALSALLNDHPEFFRIYSYDYCFNTNSGIILNIQYYLTNYPELANATVATNNVNAKIDDISEDVDTDEIRFNSDYDLVNQLIDLFNDKYTLVGTDASYDNQSNAAGALYNGHADSFGAAQAFKLLCDYNDISCIYAEGYAGNSNAAFNLVQLEGEWFLCDVTSVNNKLTKLPSNYALMNPSIYGDNALNVKIFTYPTINSTNYMILGDADLDSVVDASDAALVLQYVLNPSVVNFNTKAKLRSDVDFDGILTATDSSIILQMVLNGNYRSATDGARYANRSDNIDYAEFIAIYNSLSDELGTDYITAEELREVFES